MQPSNGKLPFCCHVDSFRIAVGGTLTQIDADGKGYAMAYFSKRLNASEENYSGNDRELLGLVYFLQRFRCYLKGSSFDVLMDNQVLKYFLSKATFNHREAQWLAFLRQFEISKLSLVKVRVYVLLDSLSIAPQTLATPAALVNILSLDVLRISLPNNFTKIIMKIKRLGQL